MKAKLYEVVSRCVLDGIQSAGMDPYGDKDCLDVVRNMSPDDLNKIHMSIMRELTEYIDFEGHAK